MDRRKRLVILALVPVLLGSVLVLRGLLRESDAAGALDRESAGTASDAPPHAPADLTGAAEEPDAGQRSAGSEDADGGLAPGGSVADEGGPADDPGPELRGVVRTPDGAPAPGAYVVVGFERGLQFLEDEDEDGEEPELGPERARTDEHGRFTLPLPEGPGVWLTAGAEDHAPSASRLVDLTAGPPGDLELHLRLGGRIHGEVLRPDGSLVPDRRVRLMRTPDPERPMELRYVRYVHTDANGRFEARHLGPGGWSLVTLPTEDELAELGGTVEEHILQDEVELEDGGDVFVQLGARSPDAVRVHGTVRVNGEPTGGLLQWIGEFPDPMSTQSIERCGEDGRYEVLLPRGGAWYVKAMVGGATAEFRFDVPQQEAWVRDLDAVALDLTGRVRDDRGLPVEGARVSHVVVDGAFPRMDFCAPSDATLTDEEGRFTFHGLPPATYQFGVTHLERGVGTGRVVLTPGLPEVELTLAGAGRVEGLLLDPDGLPAGRVTLWVHRDGHGWLEPVSRLRTDPDGRFRTPPLPPGEYAVLARTRELLAFATGLRPARAAAAAADASEGDGDPAPDLVLHLAPGGTVVVAAPGASGAERADVRLVDADGRLHSGLRDHRDVWAWQRRPFDSRRVHVGPLPAGTYAIHARLEGLAPRTGEATLTGAETLEVELR